MKIAFLSFYNGKIDRGVEVAVEALAKRLVKKHLVAVFQTGDRTIPGVPTTKLPLKVNWVAKDQSGTWMRKLYLDYWSKKIAVFTLKFIPYFRKEKYDVMIPTNGGWQLVIVRLLTWIYGKKILVQGNAGIGHDDLFQLHCFPDSYIAISPQGFIWAKRFVPWIRKTYIPYGVDTQAFQKTKPAMLSLKKPIVLCVGAFSAYKRIDCLIRAMTQVKNASLLIIGMGPLESELRQLGEKLLGDRFQLLTGVNHDQLLGYYKAADIFSLPSRSSEALGIVYIEAMAARLPIVAPDDWRREIIGKAGVYINPENSDEYAEGIKRALTSNFGDKPLKQAKKFDWSYIVGQYEELLDKFK